MTNTHKPVPDQLADIARQFYGLIASQPVEVHAAAADVGHIHGLSGKAMVMVSPMPVDCGIVLGGGGTIYEAMQFVLRSVAWRQRWDAGLWVNENGKVQTRRRDFVGNPDWPRARALAALDTACTGLFNTHELKVHDHDVAHRTRVVVTASKDVRPPFGDWSDVALDRALHMLALTMGMANGRKLYVEGIVRCL